MELALLRKGDGKSRSGLSRLYERAQHAALRRHTMAHVFGGAVTESEQEGGVMGMHMMCSPNQAAHARFS